MKTAQWIISEAGLVNLNAAGITTGWLKAWLLSAGVADVSIHLLETGAWQGSDADHQLFFASDKELKSVAEFYDYNEQAEADSFRLENPTRHCSSFMNKGKHILLLPLGDIAYQRHVWLLRLHAAEALLPLYVCADDSLSTALEPGLSASLELPADDHALNAEGLLIEEQVIRVLKQRQLSIRTVESCTAGSITARLCRVPGASDVLDRAWVTYSNAAKIEAVGVHPELLEQHGAVSEAVVRAMAEGGADEKHICIAVSGIAGPGGGTDDKPVGTVWIAVALDGQEARSQCLHLAGSRSDIQARTVIASLHLLLTMLNE